MSERFPPATKPTSQNKIKQNHNPKKKPDADGLTPSHSPAFEDPVRIV